MNRLTGSVIRIAGTWAEPSVSVLCNNIINRISDETRNYNKYKE